MENTKTRDSILKMFFSPFKDMIINSDDDNNSIPTMSDLRAIDWELVSDADKKELLIKSPNRMEELIKKFFNKVSSKKTKKIDMPDELELKYGPAKPENPIYDQAQKMNSMEKRQKEER